jgi:hypothetical protein
MIRGFQNDGRDTEDGSGTRLKSELSRGKYAVNGIVFVSIIGPCANAWIWYQMSMLPMLSKSSILMARKGVSYRPIADKENPPKLSTSFSSIPS